MVFELGLLELSVPSCGCIHVNPDCHAGISSLPVSGCSSSEFSGDDASSTNFDATPISRI
jgi:hypothetical protein